MKYLLATILIVFTLGCSKHESPANEDSLLTSPLNAPPASQSEVDSTGLYIDSFMVQQQPDIEKLNGIDPIRVVQIYDAFQPLRNHSTTPAVLDSFLRSQKITAVQLKADLAEGDRLGWGKALKHQ